MGISKKIGFALYLTFSSVMAETITVQYEAIIIEQSELLDIDTLAAPHSCIGSNDEISIGDTISGYYSYDSTSVNDPLQQDSRNFIAFTNDARQQNTLPCNSILGQCQNDFIVNTASIQNVSYNDNKFFLSAGSIGLLAGSELILKNYFAGDISKLNINSPLSLQDWQSGELNTNICHTAKTGRRVTAILKKLETVREKKNVFIDIRPRKCPNHIRIPVNKSDRKFHVALLGQADFNVDNVDLTSIHLEGIRSFRNKIKDLTTPHYAVNPQDPKDCGRVVKDGYKDIQAVFLRTKLTQAIERKLGRPAVNGEVVSLMVTGKLNDGSYFEGEDLITIKAKL